MAKTEQKKEVVVEFRYIHGNMCGLWICEQGDGNYLAYASDLERARSVPWDACQRYIDTGVGF